MITVINKTNKGLYNQLFNDVEEWLRTHNGEGQPIDGENVTDRDPLLGEVQAIDPETNQPMVDGNGDPVMEPDSITSLGELFTFMEFITKYAPIYTRLPLDEEPFFIDANKRSIDVPKDFAANGISVQGDEIAEILFFKINRFFDATDLSQCEIYIQWKTSELDENGQQKEGVSRTWIQDIDSEPGYLIFGWPISSAITNTAGNVTFSVRFYRLNNADELIYSFSTLDQTVSIKPALDYDIEDIASDSNRYVVDDMAANIRDRAINSPSSGAEAPELPYWEANKLNLFKSDIKVLRDPSGSDTEEANIKFYIMNLDMLNGFSTKPLIFHMDALSEDSGIVSYSWTKVGINGSVNNEDEPFYMAINYIVTDDDDSYRPTNKTYYRKEGNAYKAIPNEVTLAEVRENDEDVYELVSTVTMAGVGRYTPFAQNRVGKYFSERITAIPVYVPYPAEPVLGGLIAKASASSELAIQPILWTEVENEEEIAVPIYLSCSVDLADEFGNDVAETGGTPTFVWKRRALGGVDFEILENMTQDQLVLSAADENAEGYYQVVVTNNLNNEEADSASSILRVTKPAVKLVLAIDSDDEVNVTAAREREMHLPVTYSGQEPNRADEDSVTYQWYWYRQGAGHTAADDKRAAAIGEYADNQNGVDGDIKIQDIRINDMPLADQQVLDSATTPNFIPPADMEGTYFCVVTNHYNGTERSVASPFYSVTL